MYRLFLFLLIPLFVACSKDTAPEFTSFTTEFRSDRDSTELYHFDILATDDKRINGITVHQIENGEVVATYSTFDGGAPTFKYGRNFVADKDVVTELKAEVEDDGGNITEMVIQVD